MRFDLLDSGFDIGLFAFAFNNSGIILIGTDAAGSAEVFDSDGIKFPADFFRNNGAAGKGGDVIQHCFPSVAETGGFNGQDVNGAAQFVDDQCG